MKRNRQQPNRNIVKRSMCRRDFLKSSVLGAGGATLASSTPGGFASGDRPARLPNIVYINSHDTGRYTQPFGFDVPTPNLQRFAEQGVLFRQAFSTAPTCSPSRASLLTGMCAHSNGMLGLAHRGFSMNDYRQHILHTLRKVGYSSTLIGLQHIAKSSDIIGYDNVPRVKGGHVEQVAPAAAEFLKGAPKQPFYLEVGFMETHREFRQPGPEDDWRYTLPPAPIPDTPRTRRDMAAFKATARKLDWGMGEVFNALEANGLVENTLVIATTDHGIAFPCMKCSLTDGGIGVSLIMRGPSGFTGGKISDAMISQIDLFPTICELLAIEKPAWLQGKSMLPIVRGEVAQINEEVFAEVNFHAAYEPKRMVRTERWKYIRHFGDRRTPVLSNCDDSLSKDLWLEHDWRDRPVPNEQLYDMIFDPNEGLNLAGNESFRSIQAEMRGRLDRWMHATADPLLQGPVVPPHGALFCDPNDTSPKEPPLIAP